MALAAARKREKMKAENEENKNSKESVIENGDSANDFSSELRLPQWSVVTFEGVAARGLSYEKALKRIKNLDRQGVSGLCILTDEAAARISDKK